MIVATQPSSPVQRAAKANGMHQGRTGQWRLGGTKSSYKISQTLSGFLIVEQTARGLANVDPLSLHAEFPGPVKLIQRGNLVRRRFEVRLGRRLQCELFSVEEQSQSQLNRLYGQLLEMATASLDDPQNAPREWSPPEAKYLVRCLTDLGYTVVTDEEQHLRLTLKRKHGDGQVRVRRGAGDLRLSMVLGKWRDLDDISIRSMLGLARQFNDRTHVVRIAWYESKPTAVEESVEENGKDTESPVNEFRCEAQVDLSGLPHDGSADRVSSEFWGAMLGSSVAALELALRQLGLELSVLAEPRHREVLELLL